MKNAKDLSLSGSQMNLHERPSPRGLTPRIKRPTSAVPAPGYDGPTRSKSYYERPQSADESLGTTGRNSEFASRCSITRSLLNSQKFDSDFDFTSPPSSPPQLKPGLTTKPPPGPHSTHLEEDIIDLKFRNWFPNSSKFSNELPVFVPDSIISTNDIPTSCRSSQPGRSSIANRHVKSDNHLNKIGFAEDRSCGEGRNVENDVHAIMPEGEEAESVRSSSRENDQQHTQRYCNHTDDEHTENKHIGNGEKEDTRSRLYGQLSRPKHIPTSTRPVGNEQNLERKEYHKQSAQQRMRYDTWRENQNYCKTKDDTKVFKDDMEDAARRNEYGRNDLIDNRMINKEATIDHQGNKTSTYEQQFNEYGQDRENATRGYYDRYRENTDIETIDENVGATSSEYYIEYKTDKVNEDNQEEQNVRYEDISKREIEGNCETYRRDFNNDRGDWNRIQESTRHPAEEEHIMTKYDKHYYINDFYRTHMDGKQNQEQSHQYRCVYETKETQFYIGDSCPRDSENNYKRDLEKNDRCDTCTRNSIERSSTCENKSVREIKRNSHNSKENIYIEHQTNQYPHQERVLQNNAPIHDESDSARNEVNHYSNSMDVMNKIYLSKMKDKHENEKEIMDSEEFGEGVRENGENIQRNVKRKSLETLSSRFSKSLSEDSLTKRNGFKNTRYLEFENTPSVRNTSRQHPVQSNTQTNAQGVHQDVSDYLEMYDFEQDEKILNHILEKSKNDQIRNVPEIKVNNEPLMNLEEYPVKDINSSTYNEIVDILKVLENEENLKTENGSSLNMQKQEHNYEQHEIKFPTGNIQNNYRNLAHSTPKKPIQIDQPQSTSLDKINSSGTIQVKDIYSFLDQVDNQVAVGDNIVKSAQSGNTSKLSELMKLSSADLAQKYLTLSINMDEKQITTTALEKRIEQIDKHCKEMKMDTDATVKRLQKFIAQLIKEKKDLGEQCSDMCKEMEKKYKQIIETMEERHKIEIKKNTDKHLAAEKIRREKWIDNKTQKIKELTVKGLEPELLKMTNAHQEEIAELRKAHNRQLEENDGMWNRKISTMKEKFEEDLQNAISQEKENNRKRLDDEIKTMENNYQQQRQHMLNEIRIERENLDRQAEDMRNEKEKELNQKLEKMAKQNKEACEILESKHQDNINRLKEELNQEKELWIQTKTAQNEEKEKLIREQCRRERDKHIELIIQKLEKEQTERNNAADAKIKSMKEQHEKDVEELETNITNIKSKLNEARTKLQDSEDTVTELKSQVHNFQIENKTQTELLHKLKTENHDLKLKSEHETNDKINRLEEEIEQTRSYFETLISRMKQDQERELSQVYGRVKETIGKKDEAISILTQQKQAALTQCASLEAILAQRKH